MTQRWGWVTTCWKMTSHCVETILQEIQSFQPPVDQRKQCHCTFYCATFFLSWLLILSFPALYVLPASAIKGVHGGGWDVPGGRDPGDQSDQGPQAAPHAPISRVDGSHPYYPAAPLNPALATEPNPSCWRHSGKRPWYDLPTFAERLLTELDFFFFRNGNHAIVYI